MWTQFIGMIADNHSQNPNLIYGTGYDPYLLEYIKAKKSGQPLNLQNNYTGGYYPQNNNNLILIGGLALAAFMLLRK